MKQVALHLFFAEVSGPPRGCITILHTCDINVVLNAMVKVNQAAILLASPGQPRHQPSKAFLLQSICNQGTTNEKKNLQNTYKSFFTPGEFSRSASLACVRSVQRKRFQFPSYPKVREDQYPQPFCLSAGVPSSQRTVLHNGRSAVCARLRGLFWCWIGASVRLGCSPLDLLLVNEA